jgi:hypothetical protein
LDLLESGIPIEIMSAAEDFAHIHFLSKTWLNNGPSSLAADLTADWRNRLQPLYRGKVLNLSTLGRSDLIGTKLWAMCDRMHDVDDLVLLDPSDVEIALAVTWVNPRDANPDWPSHVETNVKELRRRLGRE